MTQIRRHRMGIGLTLIVLAVSATAAADELGRTVVALDLAVIELATCCDGRLDEADWNQQRRWAYGLYQWIVMSEGAPAWSAVAQQSDLEAQCRATSAEYVTTVAVRNRRWLQEHRDTLPASEPGGADLARFASTIYLLGAFEQEIESAELDYQRQRAGVERRADSRRREIEGARTVLLAGIDGARERDEEFTYDAAVAGEMIRLKSVVAEREAEIKQHQQDFWDYRTAWNARTAELVVGTVEYGRAIDEYEERALRSNDRILELTDVVVRLETRQRRLDPEQRKHSLREIEVPSAGRPTALRRTAAER